MSSEKNEKEFAAVTMKHTEGSLRALSHMQYDLFCKKNLISRTLIAFACIILAGNNLEQWWAYLLLAYGGYLLTSKYSAADRTAKKVAAQLSAAEGGYPYSRYIFENDRMRIIAFPEEAEMEPVPYSEVFGLGEDADAYYIFRNQYGGYMIPKDALGEKRDDFRTFIEKKTGKPFMNKRSRFVALRSRIIDRRNRPPRL